MAKKSPALIDAIERAGNAAELAKKLGIKAQAISQWQEVPWNRVLDVERITGVPRQDLRPDIYPRSRAS